MREQYQVSENFVTFYSPGTFVHEETTKVIESWDIAKAKRMAQEIVERYRARPFGFRFTTRARKEDELDSRVVDTSPMYYLGGTIMTLAEVKERSDPKDRILICNMENNGWDKIIVNNNSWRMVRPLLEGDVVLQFEGFSTKDVEDA